MERFSGGSKVQMERLYTIYDRVKSVTLGLAEAGGHARLPNCSHLADELEVSSKTIARDIQFMVDRLGVPMEYDAKRHGYLLSEGAEEWGGLKEFELGVEDLAALFLAKQALKPIKGTKLAESLRPAFEKLGSLLEGKVNLNWNDLDSVFSMKDLGGVDVDLTLFGKLAEAVMACREVSFDYKKLAQRDGAKKLEGTGLRAFNESLMERRQVRPYHVGEVGGGWYLIGFDVNRGEVRTFALQRIKKLRVLKALFEMDADFQIEQYLGGSLGIWGDNQAEGRRYKVEVEVCGWVAQLVQERRWHESQSVRLLHGNRVNSAVVSFELGQFEELVQLVLGWGRNAKVLKPKKLQNMVKTQLEEMLNSYQ